MKPTLTELQKDPEKWLNHKHEHGWCAVHSCNTAQAWGRIFCRGHAALYDACANLFEFAERLAERETRQ